MPKYPDDPFARPGSPWTAFAAAKSIQETARTIRVNVLAVVEEAAATGATGDDVAAHLELHVTQVRSRLSELLAAKKITNSGRVRVGVSGRHTTVWVLPQFAPVEDDNGEAQVA